MTSALPSVPKRRRFGAGAFTALGLGVLAMAVFFVWRSSRAETRTLERGRAAEELTAFDRCLVGRPLGPGEALVDRTRGIELALALAQTEPEPAPPNLLEQLLAKDAGANASADAGDADAGAADAAPSTKASWPGRCAPLADALARTLDNPALAADPTLDALREALPTRDRLEMGYALRADEAADLTAAIAKSGLREGEAGDTPGAELPPEALASAAIAKDLMPLGKGKLPLVPENNDLAHATDPLQTSEVHLLIPGAGKGGRLCAVEKEGAKGPYSTAKCGELPADWKSDMRLANREDGAPLAFLASKRTSGEDNSMNWAGGVAIFAPGGQKTLPMRDGPGASTSAYISKDGDYMLSSPQYLSFVRVGNIAKLKTTDLAQTLLDSETAQVLPSIYPTSVAAYGLIFYQDNSPLYTSYDPSRQLWGQRVRPSVDAAVTGLGEAPSNYGLELREGCQIDGRKVLLFTSDHQRQATDERFIAGDKITAPLVMAEGDGPIKRVDVEVGKSLPHLLCTKEGAVVTSARPAKERGNTIVIESRCTSKGCETHASDPIRIPAASQIDAASTDAGVLLVWKTRADLTLSPARAMVFYHLAPIDKLASTPPRPLFENKRHGGMDIDGIHLFARGPAAIIALEAGGKTPTTYAARVDASGAPSPIVVEETKW